MRVSVNLVFDGTYEEISRLVQELEDESGLKFLVKRLKELVPEISVLVEVVSPAGYLTGEEFVSLGRPLGEEGGFLRRIWGASGRCAEQNGVRRFFHPDYGWSCNVEDLKRLCSDQRRLESIPNFGKRSIEVFTQIVESL